MKQYTAPSYFTVMTELMILPDGELFPSKASRLCREMVNFQDRVDTSASFIPAYFKGLGGVGASE